MTIYKGRREGDLDGKRFHIAIQVEGNLTAMEYCIISLTGRNVCNSHKEVVSLHKGIFKCSLGMPSDSARNKVPEHEKI